MDDNLLVQYIKEYAERSRLKSYMKRLARRQFRKMTDDIEKALLNKLGAPVAAPREPIEHYDNLENQVKKWISKYTQDSDNPVSRSAAQEIHRYAKDTYDEYFQYYDDRTALNKTIADVDAKYGAKNLSK